MSTVAAHVQEEAEVGPSYTPDDLLEYVVARDASDLHLTCGSSPVVRVKGELDPINDLGILTPADTQWLIYRILSTEQQKQLEIKRQIDLSYALPGLARFLRG